MAQVARISKPVGQLCLGPRATAGTRRLLNWRGRLEPATMVRAGSTRDRLAGDPPPRASQLRLLARSLPPVDRALDDFIARANQTEIAVSDAEVISEAPAPDPSDDGDSSDPGDPGDPGAGRPAAELDREDARAREQALRDQLVGVLDRLTDVEAREQAQRDQLAGLQGQLAEATTRAAAARPETPRRWRWLAVAAAFVAGLAAMLAVARLGGRSEPAPAPPAASPGAGGLAGAAARAADSPAASGSASPAVPGGVSASAISPVPAVPAVPAARGASASASQAPARPASTPEPTPATGEQAHRAERPVPGPAAAVVPGRIPPPAPLVDPFAPAPAARARPGESAAGSVNLSRPSRPAPAAEHPAPPGGAIVNPF
jgi:hypothetical protein